MEWLLGGSVLLNALLIVIILVLTFKLYSAKQFSEYYLKGWEKWEARWYEAQNAVNEKYGDHLSIGDEQTVNIKDKG